MPLPGGPGGRIRQEHIEFVTKGLDSARQAFDAITKGLDRVTRMMEPVNQGLNRAGAMIDSLAGKFVGFASGGVLGFTALGAAVGAWVKQGMAATAQGNLLQLQFQLLTREVGSLFLPAIERVTAVAQQLTQIFHALSGPQQTTVRLFLEGAVAAGAALIILPKLAGAFSLVGTALRGLASGNPVTAVLALLVPVLVGVGAALAAVVVGTREGRAILADLWSTVQGLTGSLSPLGAMLSNVGRTIAGQLLGLLQRTADGLKAALGPALERMAPLLARLGEAAGAAFGQFLNLVEDLTPSWNSVFSAVQAGVSGLTAVFDFWNGGIHTWRVGIESVKIVLEAFPPVWADLKDAGGNAVGFIKNLFLQVAAFVEFLDRKVDELIKRLSHLGRVGAFLAGGLAGAKAFAEGGLREITKDLREIIGEAERRVGERDKARKPVPVGSAPGHDEKRRDLLAAGGGIEGVEQTWRRLQSAALKAGAEAREEKKVRLLEKIKEVLEKGRHQQPLSFFAP